MKTWLLALLTLGWLGSHAFAAPPPSTATLELSPPQAGSFPPLRPFHAEYKFGWTAFTAADGAFDYRKGKGGQMRMEVTAHTTGFVRTLWQMDLEYLATLMAASLRPVSVVQTETYAKKTIKTSLDFNATGVTRLREITPPDPKPPKSKPHDFPNLFDLNSALHWVRSQPLKNGDRYRIAVYPGGTTYLAQIDVAGREKINAAGRSWNAIKLNLQLWHVTDNLQLEPHSKFKNAAIWTSDDANRVLLKIEADIFVGSVWAEMQSLDFK